MIVLERAVRRSQGIAASGHADRIASTAPAIQRRYVPNASTSGDQKTLSVHAKPTALRRPIVVSST